jgi:O-antigen/teichoic acid export membrane protein
MNPPEGEPPDDHRETGQVPHGGPLETSLEDLSRQVSGIGFLYEALELMAARWELSDAVIVLVNQSLGTQIFRLGGKRVPSGSAGKLAPGFYCWPDHIPVAERDMVYVASQRALSLHVLRHAATRGGFGVGGRFVLSEPRSVRSREPENNIDSQRESHAQTSPGPRAGRLVQNAVALIISGAGSGAIGILFWAVAAHSASVATIGRTSAEIAAMVLLATVAQLSFGTSFERFLPVAGAQTRIFVKRAYVMCTAIGLVVAIAYVALGFSHSFLPKAFGWRAVFVAGVVMWTVFALQDSVLIGLRASRLVPVENILYSIVKLALIPVFIIVSSTQGVLLAWIVPVIALIFAINWYLFKIRIPGHERSSTSSESLPSARELFFLTGAQYATLLITIGTSSVVTLVVIDRLGAIANAHYYLPAQIANGVAASLWSIDRSFLVEASAERHDLRRHAKSALRAGLLLLGTGVLLGELFAPDILRIFGASYEADGTTLLRLLLLSLPGTAVAAFYSSFAWIDRRIWILTVRELLATAVLFALIFVLIGRFGILAIGIASIIESGLQGVLFLPILIKRYRMMPPTSSVIEA